MTLRFSVRMLTAVLLFLVGVSHGQDAPKNMTDMPGMQMSVPGQGQTSSSSNLVPELGEARPGSGPIYQLADLEKKALQQNPTLAQAQAGVRETQGRKTQAGLWPNPTIGYLGDEIAGGAGVNGGRQGGFVEQTIVLGRKLYLAQKVAGAEVNIANLEQEEQHYRVQNSVRVAYFQTLAAQELALLADRYVDLASVTLQTTRELRNTGARDESEVAMAEIELARAQLAADVQKSQLRNAWENLRSVVGDYMLPVGQLGGKLDADLPQLDSGHLLSELLSNSPAIRIAKASTLRAESATQAARRQAVPDLQVKAGVEQNFEQNELTGQPFGLEGFAEVRVELPIFNHNQGGVASALAAAERSQAETRRVELQLRRQAAGLRDQYETARITVDRYQSQILPRLRTLYDMQLKAWGRMALSYPQVLSAQQSLFAAQAEYIRALQRLRTNAITLSGFLQVDGLASPGPDTPMVPR